MTNYFSVVINGSTYGVKFNNITREILGKLLNSDPVHYGEAAKKVLEESPSLFWAKILYAGILTCFRIKEQTCDLTQADVNEWVGDQSYESLEEIVTTYNAAFNDTPKEIEIKENKKKKESRGAKSKRKQSVS